MTQEGFKRKLTAILSANAVGYSRLMGDDEAATVHTISAYPKFIRTYFDKHQITFFGKESTPNDGLFQLLQCSPIYLFIDSLFKNGV
jgi:hypothetical protein